MTAVKLCGLTRAEDVRACVEAGADAVGFVFAAGSPRRVSAPQARELASQLPPFVTRVGVFVDAPLEEVLASARTAGLDAIQLCGDEPPVYARKLAAEGLRVIRAVPLRDLGALEDLFDYPADAYLLDGWRAGARGGTGVTADWELAARAVRESPRPILLAGGLRPENVAQAVRRVRPYGVDVSSGVEASPGRKDPAGVRAFVERVRRVDGPGGV